MISRHLRRVWRALHYDEVALACDSFAHEIERERSEPVLVDVGAHHGGSVRWFLERGWTAYAFEPDPSNRARLERLRSDRLHIVSAAVSDTESEERPFFTSPVSDGISSLESFHTSHSRSHVVSTTTLASFFAREMIERVDVLKIDVEGHELSVLRGMDWSVAPRIVICEFDNTKRLPQPPSADAVVAELRSAGYTVLISEWEPVVRYGGHHKPLAIRLEPSSVADRAWGNVLGFSEPRDLDRFQRRARIVVARSRRANAVTTPIAVALRRLRNLRPPRSSANSTSGP